MTNDTQGGASTDQSSDATAPATDVGDVAKAINALLKALQRAGFTSAAGTSGDMAATGTDDGSPLSQLMGKLAKALAALEKDEKKGVAPSTDDLKQLQAAVTALSGYLATLQAGATAKSAGNAAGPATTDGSTAISDISSLLGSPAGSAGGVAQSGAADDGNAAGATVGSGNGPLGQLADKIEALSSALAQTQPGLAGDLDQLAKALAPEMRGAAAQTSAAGTAAAGVAAPNVSAPGALKDAAGSSATVNAPTVQSTGATAPAGASTKGSHSSKPDSDKSADRGDNAPDKTASTDRTAGSDKTGVPATSTAVGPTDNASNGSPSGTTPAQAGAQAAVALAPQVPVGGGTAIGQQAQAAYQPVDTAAVNLPQMAFEIARHVDHGSSQFQIRLDPADLGRVDVKLAVDSTGAISAHLSAERPETLDLLRRDAGALNQALTQAGLDGSKTNLQFSLSQNPFTRQDNNPQAQGQPASQAGSAGDNSAATPIPVAPAISLYRGHMTSSGLNIFV